MTTQYTYTVLRYVHDVVSGEFINVGLVMHVPRQQRVLSRTLTRSTIRIRTMFPNLDESAFTSGMCAVQRALDMAKPEVSEVDAAAFAQCAIPMDSSSLQWSPQGSGLSGNVEETFERLYERHITHYEPLSVGNENVITVGSAEWPNENRVPMPSIEWGPMGVFRIDPLANNTIGLFFGNLTSTAARVPGSAMSGFLPRHLTQHAPLEAIRGSSQQGASNGQFLIVSTDTQSRGIPGH